MLVGRHRRQAANARSRRSRGRSRRRPRISRVSDGGADELPEAGVEAAAQDVVRFARLQLLRLQPLPQLLRDDEPLLEVEQRIGPEIELARVGVEPGDRFLVGREGEQRIGRAARGDLGELVVLGLLRQRPVRVFDRPVVVGADRRLDVGALRFALHGDVERVVVHHRARDAHFAAERRVRDLRERVHGGARGNCGAVRACGRLHASRPPSARLRRRRRLPGCRARFRRARPARRGRIASRPARRSHRCTDCRRGRATSCTRRTRGHADGRLPRR